MTHPLTRFLLILDYFLQELLAPYPSSPSRPSETTKWYSLISQAIQRSISTYPPSHSSTYTAAPYRFQRIIRYHVFNYSGFPDSIFQVRCSSGITNHERLVLNIYQSIHHIIRFLDMCNPYPVFCMVILHFNYG